MLVIIVIGDVREWGVIGIMGIIVSVSVSGLFWGLVVTDWGGDYFC